MANICKQSKRGGLLPRVTNGSATTGERYGEFAEHEPRERGRMPGMMYTLNVAAPGSDGVEYQVQLTEDEMIRASGEWLSKLASRRSREAFDARIRASRVTRNAS